MSQEQEETPHARISPDYIRGHEPIRRGKVISIFLAAAIAFLWLSFGSSARRDELFNPGPVAMVHHQFQTDCAQCHDGDGKGGFLRGVSDNACFKCHSHDAAIHHQNQKVAKSPGEVSRASLTLAIFDESHAKLRSADCMACHVEHRGDPALAAKEDSYCVMCHRDLKAALPAGVVTSATLKITAFNVDHPSFGRELRDAQGVAVDPTVLNFSHKSHLQDIPGHPGPGPKSCVQCHQSEPDGKYMKPVTFENNCKQCHALDLGPPSAKTTMPHGSMAGVRNKIAALKEDQLAWLAPKPGLQDDNPDPTAPPAAAVPTSPNELALETIGANFKSATNAEFERLKKVINTQPVAADRPWIPDARIIQFAVVFTARHSCVSCHGVIGDAAVAFDAGATRSRDSGNQLDIIPTGIPTGILKSQPRRWYVNSSFNHKAHVSIASCLDCHAAAGKSTRTADLLLPDIGGRVAGHLNASTVNSSLLKAPPSCLSCHNPPATVGHKASSDCAECHVFHDRSQEARDSPAVPRLGG